MPPTAQLYDIDVYYKMRITLDDEVNQAEDIKKKHGGYVKIHDVIMRDVMTPFITTRMTTSLEYKGGSGEFVKPHIHVAYKSRHKKDTIDRAIKRWWEAQYDEKLSGNKCYMNTPVALPDSEDKFFRYNLKQQNPDDYPTKYYKGFTAIEIKDMTIAAAACAKVVQEINIKKNSKTEEKDTLYDRLAKKLDKGQGTLEEIIQFYMDENRAINDQVISGYYSLYRLKTKKISVEEYALKIKSRYNL